MSIIVLDPIREAKTDRLRDFRNILKDSRTSFQRPTRYLFYSWNVEEINACSKEPTCVRVVVKRATVRTRLLNTGRRDDDTAAGNSATKIQHDRQARTITRGRHSDRKQRRSDCVEDATFQAIPEVLCHNRQVKVV
ncbi:hypothetical protein MHYP_G00070760 [Metynnis hypsauchen]